MIRRTVWCAQPKERGTEMEKSEVGALFCEKIGLEIGRFRKRMLGKGPEEIYGRAYQIDCMVCIYEQLLEISGELKEEELKRLLVFPDILSFLYGRWLRQEDSFSEELQNCINDEIQGIQGIQEKYRQIVQREQEEAA